MRPGLIGPHDLPHFFPNWDDGYFLLVCLFGPCVLQSLKQAFQKQIQQVQVIALRVHYDRLDASHPTDELSI